MSVVDLIARNPDCTISVNFYKQGGAVADHYGKLKGKGPYTVFVPTDAAYAKLNPQYVHKLLKDDKQLANILRYQAIDGAYSAEHFKNSQSAQYYNTHHGERMNIYRNGNYVFVGNDRYKAMIVGSQAIPNGYIHYVDNVLASQNTQLDVLGGVVLGSVIGGAVAGVPGLAIGAVLGGTLGAEASQNNNGLFQSSFFGANWVLLLLFLIVIILLILFFVRFRTYITL